jgi:hypothetical protein
VILFLFVAGRFFFAMFRPIPFPSKPFMAPTSHSHTHTRCPSLVPPFCKEKRVEGFGKNAKVKKLVLASDGGEKETEEKETKHDGWLS